MKVYESIAVLALAATFAAPGVANAQGRGRGVAKNAARQDQTENRKDDRQMRFQGMDTDNDGVITRDEWRGNAESFRQHDTNGDGVLSGDEVRVPAGREQGDTQQDRSRREERLARFDRLDTNLDGRISLREWTGSRAMFDRMDRNHDEFMSRNEFMDVALERPAGAARTQGTAGESQAQTRAYQAGHQKGLEEGRQAGREDKNVNGGKWDLEGQRELEQADSGYRNELGVRADYQAGYRAGFRLGYREGFGPRR